MPVTDPDEADRPAPPATGPESDAGAPADPTPPSEPAPAAAVVAAPSSSGLTFGAAVRRRTLRRFGMAFIFGLLGALAVTAGALAAFESSNEGRILPGVRVGSVDLSGLSPADARIRLVEAYGSLAEGTVTLVADGTSRPVSYAEVGRRLDVDAVVNEAMAVGRDGATIERIASHVRTLIRGVDVAPVATFDATSLREALRRLAADVDVDPTNASVALTGEDFVVSEGANGRSADVDAAFGAVAALLTDAAAPDAVRVTVPLTVVKPAVDTAEAEAAREAALRIAVDTDLADATEVWTITGATIRGWISFAPTADGGYGPIVAREGLEAGLTAIAGDVARAPVNASFLVGDGQAVVGVTDSRPGRALDVPATVETLAEVIEQRTKGLTVRRMPVATTIVEPEMTTEEATATAPLMKPISEWTTYFPIGIKNGNGANIWIPAEDIDGMVILPGGWFDFWEAVGPITRERGYKDGGAIINGRTEPQGALAGGICSCSTTLFNAALRAGLEMGARRNHYYYIDRYPLGLDATVFKSSSGSTQTMSWRNDTDAPILIRGYGWRDGSKGYVKFVLWSVPTGRKVTFSNPIVKNVRPASDSVVYTTSLAPGVRDRIEFPVDGKDVWVTRTVKDAAGNVLHQETYYSHYARITGIVRIGVAPTPDPDPSPSP